MLNAERLTSNRFVSDEYGIVDVKSSQFNKKYFWHFLIRRDKLPDHFAFACFDDDLEFIRCYLVPANVVQDRRNLTITRGSENKWLPYLTYAIDIQSLKSPKQSKVIARSTPYIVRRNKKKSCCFLSKEILFKWIWLGTRIGHLYLRSQIAFKHGKLYYCDRKFPRARWAWHPPKVIRLQGRSAKEHHTISNNAPIDWVCLVDKWVKVRRHCDECNGDLVYGPDKSLYCKECGLQTT